jgi:hypothetical protein
VTTWASLNVQGWECHIAVPSEFWNFVSVGFVLFCFILKTGSHYITEAVSVVIDGDAGDTVFGCICLATCTREQVAQALCSCGCIYSGWPWRWGRGQCDGVVQGNIVLQACTCFSVWHGLCVTVRVCEC